MPAPVAIPSPVVDDHQFITMEEFARLSTLSRWTIGRLWRAGDMPPPRQLSRGRIGWPRHVVNAWLASRRQA